MIRGALRSTGVLTGDALASLMRRPGHTIAMMSGIMLGVASAIGVIIITDTQQAQIDLRFDLQRSDHVVIKIESPTSAPLPAQQVELVRNLPAVSDIGEFTKWTEGTPVSRSVTSPSDVPVVASVLVADAGGIKATGTKVLAGAASSLMNAEDPPALAWVGASLAKDLGVTPATGLTGVESQVVVGGTPFSVAGIMSNNTGYDYLSHSIIMPRAVAVEWLGGVGANVRLIAHVRPGSAPSTAEFAVAAVDVDGALNARDVTPPDGEILVGQVGSDLRRIGAALGLFIGIVGMIAVGNTLALSVHQRLRELGLRSAMGWPRRRIGLLVLCESAIAGLLAGILGAGAGLGIASAWCWWRGWELIMPPTLPAIMILGAVAASVIGGMIPALRAASVSPMAAMRS